MIDEKSNPDIAAEHLNYTLGKAKSSLNYWAPRTRQQEAAAKALTEALESMQRSLDALPGGKVEPLSAAPAGQTSIERVENEQRIILDGQELLVRSSSLTPNPNSTWAQLNPFSQRLTGFFAYLLAAAFTLISPKRTDRALLQLLRTQFVEKLQTGTMKPCTQESNDEIAHASYQRESQKPSS